MALFGKKDAKKDAKVDKKAVAKDTKKETKVVAKPAKKETAKKVETKKVVKKDTKPVTKTTTKTTVKTSNDKGKFIIRKAKENYVFALQAANFQNVATSGSGYKSLSACKLGVESTKRFLGSPIEDQTLVKVVTLTNPKYEIYLDKAEQFRFRLKASNGEIILVSDSYTTKTACKNGIDSIQRTAPSADVEIIKSK